MKQFLVAVTLVIALVLLVYSLMDDGAPPAGTTPDPSPPEPAASEVAVILDGDGAGEGSSSEEISETVGDTAETADEEVDSVIEWSLAGRVVGADDTPIASATVAAISPYSFSNQARDALSDEEGLFLIAVERDFVGSLEVRAEGMVGRRLADVRPEEGMAPTLTIRLLPGGTIEGVVVDLENHPVAEAEVAAAAPSHALGLLAAFQRPNQHDDRLWPLAISAADGTFTLVGMPEGACSLQARHEGFGESKGVNLPPGATEARLVLRELCFLTGTVIDGQGGPLAAITVLITPFDMVKVMRLEGGGVGVSGRQKTTTDQAGTFSFASSYYGMHMLDTETDNFTGSLKMVTLGGGENAPVELVLSPAASVSGRVLDSEGNPVRFAKITAATGSGLQRQISGTTFSLATSDTDGLFFLQPVQSNQDVILEVKHRDHPTLETAPRRFLLGETDVGDLVFADGLHLRGVVLDPGGSPLAGVKVTVAAQKEEGESTGRTFKIAFSSEEGGVFTGPDENLARDFTDSTGEFQLTLEEGGALTLEASASGYVDAEPQALTVAESIDGLVLRLRPSIAIDGVVVDRSGNPVPEVRLTLSKSTSGAFFFPGLSDRDGVTATSGPDGAFAADVESEGRYRLKVADNQRWLLPETQFIEAGSAGVEVMVVGAGRIEGRVRDASSGQPIARFNLQHGNVQFAGFRIGGMMGMDFEDPEGYFEIDGLDGKTYKLTVKADGYIPLTEEVEIELGRTTQVDIALMHSATIVGRLLDSAGEAVASASIVVFRPGENPNASASEFTGSVVIATGGSGDGEALVVMGEDSLVSDKEGRFRASGLEEGDWQVKVTHRDFQEHFVEVTGTALGRVTDIGDQWLKKGAVIGGKIIMPAGSSPDFGVITAQRIDGGGNETQQGNVTPSADGPANWQIGGLAAGRWRISGNVFYTDGDPGTHPDQLTLGPIEVRLASEEVRSLDLTATPE